MRHCNQEKNATRGNRDKRPPNSRRARVAQMVGDPAWCAQVGQYNAAYAWENFEAGIVSAEIAALYDRIANS